jgi:hypothetical protein
VQRMGEANADLTDPRVRCRRAGGGVLVLSSCAPTFSLQALFHPPPPCFCLTACHPTQPTAPTSPHPQHTNNRCNCCDALRHTDKSLTSLRHAIMPAVLHQCVWMLHMTATQHSVPVAPNRHQHDLRPNRPSQSHAPSRNPAGRPWPHLLPSVVRLVHLSAA